MHLFTPKTRLNQQDSDNEPAISRGDAAKDETDGRKNGGPAASGRNGGNGESVTEPFIRVMTKKEALEFLPADVRGQAGKLLEQGIRFCSAEEFPGYLAGTFYIPAKSMHKSHSGFYYVLRQEGVTFVDDSGFVMEKLKEMDEARRWKSPCAGQYFAEFLDFLLDGDAVFITEMENRLAELEDDMLAGVRKDYNHVISAYRRKIMAFSHYYLQLSDMASVLQEDENHFFAEEEQRLFELSADRVNRLREEAQLLREYSIQIREVYQSQIDVHQNEIMKILTVVTTLFLPLSLIAAWYGMNFKYMPELSWRYGYVVVIAVSLAVAAFCIWLFRKKKFW